VALFSLLLVAFPVVGQDQSASAKHAALEPSVEAVSAAAEKSATNETDDSSSTAETTAKKSRGAAHFELNPELASTGKSKSSFAFAANKLKPFANLNTRSNAADAQAQQATPGGTAGTSAADAGGEHDAAELSKKLANPVSSLISFPIQTNVDFGMGAGHGWKMTMNFQPVIPVPLNKKWNMISRTIVPVIHQSNVVAAGTSQSGLGDISQSLFFSPNKSEPFVWAVGPVVLIPTATNEFLGGKQLGLGPTALVLKQHHGWTAGALWNHVWRVAGGSGRPKVNFDFVQPFLSYSTKDGWTYGLNTESTYDWTGNSWSVPIHFSVAKIVRFGKQPISFGGAVRCWATSPAGGPEGCGLRMIVTGIFPRK
jgi:hypothetical protein